MATKLSVMQIGKNANIVETSFFSLVRVVKRREELGIIEEDFDVLTKAQTILANVSLHWDARLNREEKELKDKQGAI